MKLYDVPRNTRISIKTDNGAPLELHFHHVDGMYSFCTDDAGNPVHLAAWADVEIVANQLGETDGTGVSQTPC